MKKSVAHSSKHPRSKGKLLRPGVPMLEGDRIVWIDRKGEVRRTKEAPTVGEMMEVDEYYMMFGPIPFGEPMEKPQRRRTAPKGSRKPRKKTNATPQIPLKYWLMLAAVVLAALVFTL